MSAHCKRFHQSVCYIYLDYHDIAEKCLTVLINTNTPLFIGRQLHTKFLKTGFHFENKYITELLLAVVM